ncbi:DUF4041 domain-containing protein [Flagellimonas halotolerans]|uniref:DUF4041 domain-containing protein n=1 Tax=Flagellimonas halotolerans TaxID=3112164 RepID=A0ABU6IUK6_9FLAO|nr:MULTISPECIES: DUF4041 domain-containing protein [unclassified Allomuricauda]MEC3966790.1 DUF4041 domain-containing protein [Muricauda sp. SYSU M86414]MEC4266694.1 DUF4041 domain-containing protein [Muricauda sp. SYSU M84420]
MDLFNKKKVKLLSDELQKCINEKDSILSQKEELLSKYSKIIDLEKEVETIISHINDLKNKRNELSIKYDQGKRLYDELIEETKIYESKLDLISYGHYDPIFDFQDSETYKKHIEEIKRAQKHYIQNGLAIECFTTWHVDGNLKKGQAMINKQMKLMLRAFNNECDVLISKVKWNNIETIEKRIQKSYNAINRLGKSNNIEIVDTFLTMKIEELKLTHEYNLKKHEEKEAQREERARIREEEKAQRDFEIAKRKAEREEALYQKALEKAKQDLGLVSGEELIKLHNKILDLENNLKAAHDQKERALSMAQQTKSGYVYVISNIGSFGENVYKIGLTRRLEPLDRVRELGDSSVPFTFDVHALIFSTDAPALENQLHQVFKEKSVNLINFRKEFFRVTLEEIENEVNKIVDKKVEFIKLSEAQEFKESISIRESWVEQNQIEEVEHKFPKHLFDEE